MVLDSGILPERRDQAVGSRSAAGSPCRGDAGAPPAKASASGWVAPGAGSEGYYVQMRRW